VIVSIQTRLHRALLALCLPTLLAPVLYGQNHFGTLTFQAPVWGFATSVSGDSLGKFVKELSGVLPVTINGSPVTIPHRYSGNGSTQFRQAAQHISNTFERYGLNPVLENNASPYTKVNVIGTLPGRVQEYVVICGHFDSANQTCPGADDNASGTAAVMEAARLLRSYRFDYTIKFIAFGGEEQGLKGSQQYMVAHPSDSIRAVVNADMIIWDGNANFTIQIHGKANASTQFSEDLADYVISVNSQYSLGLTCDKHVPGLTGSDHSSFWNAGRSAVCLIEEYQVDFCPYYHTANDVWSNYTANQHQRFFQRSGALAIASTASLAQPIAPVPVELASFTADAQGTRVQLRWRTASETNNRGFYIQRAERTADSFADIGFVEGRGTSRTAAEYGFADAPATEGIYRYRLRQVDYDGTEALSRPIAVELATVRELALAQNYPNPFSGMTTIRYDLPSEGSVRLAVFDKLGRELFTILDGTFPAGRLVAQFDGSALPPGIYFCRLETSAGSKSIRMQKIP
jgi:hypothetical protein